MSVHHFQPSLTPFPLNTRSERVNKQKQVRRHRANGRSLPHALETWSTSRLAQKTPVRLTPSQKLPPEGRTPCGAQQSQRGDRQEGTGRGQCGAGRVSCPGAGRSRPISAPGSEKAPLGSEKAPGDSAAGAPTQGAALDRRGGGADPPGVGLDAACGRPCPADVKAGL